MVMVNMVNMVNMVSMVNMVNMVIIMIIMVNMGGPLGPGWVHRPDLQFHKSKHCSWHTMLRGGSEKNWKVIFEMYLVKLSSSSCLIRRMALQCMTNSSVYIDK